MHLALIRAVIGHCPETVLPKKPLTLTSALIHSPSVSTVQLRTLNKLLPLSTESTLCMFDLLWFLLSALFPPSQQLLL